MSGALEELIKEVVNHFSAGDQLSRAAVTKEVMLIPRKNRNYPGKWGGGKEKSVSNRVDSR